LKEMKWIFSCVTNNQLPFTLSTLPSHEFVLPLVHCKKKLFWPRLGAELLYWYKHKYLGGILTVCSFSTTTEKVYKVGGGPLLNDFLRPELDREMIPHSLSTFRMRNKL
jgi:hypothetical protein